MSCSPFDLNDYYFGELSNTDRQAMDKHIGGCVACREQLDRLEMTRAALLSVRDEDPPRRIAFVSDKVFEPAWYQRLWQSGAKLAFASAGMLSAAIVAHGYLMRPPAPVAYRVAAPYSVTNKVDPAAVKAEVERQLTPALQAVLDANDKRQQTRIEQIATEQKRYREDLNALGENFSVWRQTVINNVRASVHDTNATGDTQ